MDFFIEDVRGLPPIPPAPLAAVTGGPERGTRQRNGHWLGRAGRNPRGGNRPGGNFDNLVFSRLCFDKKLTSLSSRYSLACNNKLYS